MAKVIKIVNNTVYLGYPDGHIEKVPIIAFDTMPSVGMEVSVYKSEDGEIVVLPDKKKLDLNIDVAQNVGTGVGAVFSIFSGRMTKGEYIVRFAAAIVLLIIIGLIGDSYSHSYRYRWVNNVCVAASIGVFIWWISCFVRRLHDMGLSSLPVLIVYAIFGVILIVIGQMFRWNIRVGGPFVVFPLLIGFRDAQPFDNEYGPYRG